MPKANYPAGKRQILAIRTTSATAHRHTIIHTSTRLEKGLDPADTFDRYSTGNALPPLGTAKQRRDCLVTFTKPVPPLKTIHFDASIVSPSPTLSGPRHSRE